MINPSTTLDRKAIAAHIVVALADAQELGHALRLDELATTLGVRKSDTRDVVSQLHAEGYVDALRLRLTLKGFALATALGSRQLRSMRKTRTMRTPEELRERLEREGRETPLARVA